MTITIDWQDVVDVAAELATVPQNAQDAILEALPLQMNEDVWGVKLNLGAAYLAAHIATVNRRRGAGGALAGQTAGQVSRTFAQAQNAGPFGSTSYGIEYERLMMTLPAARFDIG